MMLELLFYVSSIVVAVTTLISIVNCFTAPMFATKTREPADAPLISVLIPARNEEDNIGNIIEDLKQQTYKAFELIILDDESEDDTVRVISERHSLDNGAFPQTLIHGKPLSTGWIGKNWACHQLSQEARGDYLLFLDADVRVKANVLESCVYYQNRYGVRMITCFPTQVIRSVGEWLVVPLMNFLLLTFLPLRKVYSSPNPSFIAANGQFLFIAKDAYDEIGGHKVVAGKIVEDMEIARRVKASGFKIMTFLGGDSITCRMYDSFESAFNGFTKNAFPGFNTSPLIFFSFLAFLFTSYFLPFLMMFMNSSFVLVVVTVLVGRLAISVSSRQNVLANILLHPVQMLVMMAIGVNSVYRTKAKAIRWKGRSI